MFARASWSRRMDFAASLKENPDTRDTTAEALASVTELITREPFGDGYSVPLYWRTCAFMAIAKQRRTSLSHWGRKSPGTVSERSAKSLMAIRPSRPGDVSLKPGQSLRF